MKLPKEIPVKLLYVLLVILLWTSVMDKPSYTKEDFDMKQMKDVKNMLINKMGNLMGNKDDKEDFKPYDKENEKLYLNKMKTSCGSPIQIN